MSEKNSGHESAPENFEAKTHESPENQYRHETKPESHKAEEKHDVEKLNKQAEKFAVSTDEISVDKHKVVSKSHSPILAQKELKSDAYNRTLIKIRRNLNPVDRNLSKIVHQPVVENLSNISSKTIARPSGILGGGLAAFLGSGLFLYLSNYYGFEYNFSMFILLFAGGFVAGLITEVLIRASTKG